MVTTLRENANGSYDSPWLSHIFDIRNTGIFQRGQKPSILEYFIQPKWKYGKSTLCLFCNQQHYVL
jgi:hypothetical protein